MKMAALLKNAGAASTNEIIFWSDVDQIAFVSNDAKLPLICASFLIQQAGRVRSAKQSLPDVRTSQFFYFSILYKCYTKTLAGQGEGLYNLPEVLAYSIENLGTCIELGPGLPEAIISPCLFLRSILGRGTEQVKAKAKGQTVFLLARCIKQLTVYTLVTNKQTHIKY